MRAPPILPITAVAVVGVLAMSGLNAIDKAPKLLQQAKAFAEGAKPADPAAKPAEGQTALPGQTPAGQTPASGQQPGAPNLPVACAVSPTDLAKEAGLSPSELQALQNLSARRGQLDDREKALETQIELLNAADAKVEAKLAALTKLKSDVQALLGQADAQSQGEVDRMVIVYSKMKPKDAAAIITTLDDKIRVPIAAKMKEKDLSAILSQMPTLEAKKLTELLANRFADAKRMSEALTNPPPEPVPPDAQAQAQPPQKPAKGKSASAKKGG
jgi:flagellar motility protein MotE (MotC chaperone)